MTNQVVTGVLGDPMLNGCLFPPQSQRQTPDIGLLTREYYQKTMVLLIPPTDEESLLPNEPQRILSNKKDVKRKTVRIALVMPWLLGVGCLVNTLILLQYLFEES